MQTGRPGRPPRPLACTSSRGKTTKIQNKDGVIPSEDRNLIAPAHLLPDGKSSAINIQSLFDSALCLLLVTSSSACELHQKCPSRQQWHAKQPPRLGAVVREAALEWPRQQAVQLGKYGVYPLSITKSVTRALYRRFTASSPRANLDAPGHA